MMKTMKLQPEPEVIIMIVLIVLFSFLLWTAWTLIGYVADDWRSPPADERSAPAAKTY